MYIQISSCIFLITGGPVTMSTLDEQPLLQYKFQASTNPKIPVAGNFSLSSKNVL